MHILQLILFSNATYRYLDLVHLCVYLHADSCSIISVMCCIIFFHCFSMLSLFIIVAHVTSTMYFCKISVSVIHSYNILLCLWYYIYHSCMCVAGVSIKMCLSIHDRRKCGSEYKIARKFYIIHSLICSKMHIYEICFITCY
jgi:hypothetical protein